jgi:hypothetical protein
MAVRLAVAVAHVGCVAYTRSQVVERTEWNDINQMQVKQMKH